MTAPAALAHEPALQSPFSSFFARAYDLLRNIRTDHVLASAAEWLEYGLTLQVATPLKAIGPFHQAVALGSDEAMTWLGLTLIKIAPLAEGEEADTLILAGVGWLETAMMAGEYHARAWFPDALRDLSPALLAKWHALPAHSQTLVN